MQSNLRYELATGGTLTSVLLAVICMCSMAMSYWGYQSLWPSLEGKVLASVMAIATFACLFLFNRFVMKAVIEQSPLSNRLGVFVLALAFSPLVIGLSSAMNVAALSGKAGQVEYLKDIEAQLSATKSDIYQQANAINQFVPVLAREAQSWKRAAHDEYRSGAFTRVGGTGAVHTTLVNYGESFTLLAKDVTDFLATLEVLNEKADANLLRLRQVMESQAAPTQMMQHVAREVDQIKALLIKMQSQDTVEGLKVTISALPHALAGITVSRTPHVAQAQRAAIAKIRMKLDQSTPLLIAAFERYQAVPEPVMPTLRPMSTLRAVLSYWYLFPQAWLAGVALDFIGLLLALMVLVLNARQTPQQRQHQALMEMPVETVMLAQQASKHLKGHSSSMDHIFNTLQQNGTRHDG